MRLMRAAPRGVAANRRSKATTAGRRFVMTSSALMASASVKTSRSPGRSASRSCKAARCSGAAINTLHGDRLTTGLRRALEDFGVLNRPPADLHLADDVLLRHWTPVAAV